MKYKVGDKVKIKSLDWYNQNKNQSGNVIMCVRSFVSDMSKYCGKMAEITGIDFGLNYYHINLDNQEWSWDDDMFEPEPIHIAPSNRTFTRREVAEIVREVAYEYNINAMEDSEIEKAVFDWIKANMNG